jgi:hypothetical protein
MDAIKPVCKMNKILAMLLVSMLFASLGVAINPVASGSTIVKVDPSLIEYYEDATGQQFTVAIEIVDVINLYGFDLNFRWNTTYLDYVSHSIHVPKDTYSDGILWNPIIPIKDEVNASAGTYWIAYTSRWPAPSFNGSGTVFTMTFKVKYHPVQPEPTANITLELYSSDLADKGGRLMPHARQNGTVILQALSSSVGGIVIPTDKFGLLAPYIGLASTILVAIAATAIYVKRVKRRKEKQ